MKVYIFLFLCQLVSAHGFLYSTQSNGPLNIRGKSNFPNNVDGLRNPTPENNICRGEAATAATPLNLKNQQTHTVSLAIDPHARHQGTCYAYLLDENLKNAVLIGKTEGKYACVYDSESSNGPCKNPPGETPGESCLVDWSFTVQNLDKVTCKNCVFQFKWVSTQDAPNIQYYNNCADVTLGSSRPSYTPPTPTTKPSYTPSTLKDQEQPANAVPAPLKKKCKKPSNKYV